MAPEIKIEKQDPEKVSSLSLAFLGDGVYELIVRNKVLFDHNGSVKDVNERSKELTRATCQSRMIMSILDELTEEEEKVYKRARNAKGVSAPKSCSVAEYRQATGFEALMGYLFLKDRIERAVELVEKAMANI